MPRASVSKLRLTPPLPRSVGLGPVFFPAQRRFVQRAVEGHPIKIQPNQVLVILQRHVPEVGKHARLYPLLKAGVGCAAGANARCAQRLPLTTRAQHEENAIQYLPVGYPPPVAAQRVRFRRVNGQVRPEPLPKRVGNAEFLTRCHLPKVQRFLTYSDSLLVATHK